MHSKPWSTYFWRILTAGALVLLIAWISGYWVPVIFIALLSYVSWLLYNNWRLHQWLSNNIQETPESFGLWSDIFNKIDKLQKKNRSQTRALEATIDEFMAVTNVFPDACLIINKDDVITWFNDAGKSLLGLKVDSDPGLAVTNLIRDPDFADWLAVQDQLNSKFDMHSPLDDNIYLSVDVIPHLEGQRLLILRDITDIHNLEKIRSDFVANVSHELRTPLTVVLGYLEAFSAQCPEEMAPAINRMLGQTTQMNALLNDLLELSRLQSDEHHSPDQEIDIPAMLTQLEELANELSQDNHDIRMNTDDSLHLKGISSDIESAFRNLIQNAVNYSPEGGIIEIWWREGENGPVFSVSDNGPGIPKRDIPRLTERFYRVGADRSRQSGGTGLGLSIVKHVLNAHQAKFIIESELGSGSCFSCNFPQTRGIRKT